MKTKRSGSGRDGTVLAVILIVLVALSLLVLALYHLGFQSGREANYELMRAQAFWLAESGRQQCVADLFDGGNGLFNDAVVADDMPGSYTVEKSGDTARISAGTVTIGDLTVTRRILINLKFLPPLYENAIYAGGRLNNPGNLPTLELTGVQAGGLNGPPVPRANTHVYGGNDLVYGNMDVNGNVRLREQSRVDTPPAPNRYDVKGDVTASGLIETLDEAAIAGSQRISVGSDYEPPDLYAMNYPLNNNWDIAAEFNKAGISSGRLPSTHPLHDLVVKNPSNRAAENASTTGDDFYFEPTASTVGSRATGETKLVLGDDVTYFIDGHVWFHDLRTYGFEVDGQAVIVASRDIHISDNIQYQNRGLEDMNGNPPDLLALVALGQYDSLGNYTTDGNIYFGDPEFGTLYTADAFMFANNDFYYNTSANSGEQMEPESGFKVFGNYVAVNQVVVWRDWYDKNTYVKDGETREAYEDRGRWYDVETRDRVYTTVTSVTRAAKFVNNAWVDAITENGLTENQRAAVKHYAMEVAYDDRIRDAATQMSGLPKGTGTIFAGIVSWEELPPLP